MVVEKTDPIDIIKIIWQSYEPVTEISKVNSKDCALARPFHVLFDKGQIPGKVNQIFYLDHKPPSKILGSICLTPENRILFFPGLIERNVNWVQSRQMNRQSVRSSAVVDHFTLEANRANWHPRLLDENRQKVKKSKGLLKSYKTKVLSKDILYWFGLSVKNPRFLETTPSILEFAFPCRQSIVRLRARLYDDAIKKAIPHLIQLSSGETKENQFIHFDFYLAPKNISVEDLTPQVPTEKAIVSNFSLINGRIECRGCPVTLEGLKEKIWVVASKYNGILSDKVIIKAF